MDNLTHSLVGALLGQAGLKRKTGLAMPALIIGANLPDIDAACITYGIESLAMRRGITHGPAAWVLLPLMLAGALWWFDLWQARRGKRPGGRLPVHFGWLYALCFIACLTHPALDWLNVYGIRLLEPFSERWFYGDALFIIDVWMWLGMGFAVWLSLRQEKNGKKWRWTGTAALVMIAAYIGGNSLTSFFAQAQVQVQAQANSAQSYTQLVIVKPVPLYPWQREVLTLSHAGVWNAAQWSLFSGLDQRPVPMDYQPCRIPDARRISIGSPAAAFLFWSRAPFAQRAHDGSISLRDARYYDPLARDRFAVMLPDLKCEPMG